MFTAEGQKVLVMAGITANSQKPMFQGATPQVVIELTHIRFRKNCIDGFGKN